VLNVKTGGNKQFPLNFKGLLILSVETEIHLHNTENIPLQKSEFPVHSCPVTITKNKCEVSVGESVHVCPSVHTNIKSSELLRGFS
jgi:hypothetical protein